MLCSVVGEILLLSGCGYCDFEWNNVNHNKSSKPASERNSQFTIRWEKWGKATILNYTKQTNKILSVYFFLFFFLFSYFLVCGGWSHAIINGGWNQKPKKEGVECTWLEVEQNNCWNCIRMKKYKRIGKKAGEETVLGIEKKTVTIAVCNHLTDVGSATFRPRTLFSCFCDEPNNSKDHFKGQEPSKNIAPELQQFSFHFLFHSHFFLLL